MPLEGEATFMSCCGQMICNGCVVAHLISNIHEDVKAKTCLFCRTPASDKEEYEKRTQERIEANDPAVLRFMGIEGYRARDYDKALKYLTKAAELGDAEAHYRLGRMYHEGDGVDKDEEKSFYHYEKATIGGHPVARSMLGCYEAKNGNAEIAAKHWIISANLGYEPSMKALLMIYKEGFITKEEYGATLRAHQAAINAMKSAQREAAERVGKLKA
jgi:TPR repeat protein